MPLDKNEGRVTHAMQEAFAKILAQKNEISALETQQQAVKLEVDSITADQSRLRENTKALKGSAEEKALLQRYTRQLDQQEDRLTTLRGQAEDLRTKHAKADEELTETIQSIALDENF